LLRPAASTTQVLTPESTRQQAAQPSRQPTCNLVTWHEGSQTALLLPNASDTMICKACIAHQLLVLRSAAEWDRTADVPVPDVTAAHSLDGAQGATDQVPNSVGQRFRSIKGTHECMYSRP